MVGSMIRIWLVFVAAALLAQEGDPMQGSRNRAERLEWFRDLGFGLFIHWSFDSQIGVVESHSLVGASDEYKRRYFEELPKTFYPRKFDAAEWATLAKLAGVKYVMFTSKHHSGYTMFHSRTTEFGIKNSPFRRDIAGELVEAFRKAGIAPGFYFSPDDFHWLHRHGIEIERHTPAVNPANIPALLHYDQTQLRELLTQYGKIDLLFLDGPWDGLRELAWDLDPNLVVTRGGMETPEQFVPGVPINGPWESCITMGTQWQYKPTNEAYKSGRELISLLIETRAKGGNLLLNIGPKPDGEIAIEQDERLREIGLWMFVNQEAIYATRPWVVTNEGEYWFTKAKDANTVYVMVKGAERWKYGEWKDIALKSVRATDKTRISVLGQNDRVLEYQPNVKPQSTFRQDGDTLHLRAMHAQRLYNNRQWPNPIVIKLENVMPALQPPVIRTGGAKVGEDRTVNLDGELESLGGAAAVQVVFQYQDVTGYDLTERANDW
jgi:alpha-L-fucosidase